MKKLILSLLALVGTMSINAQMIEIYDGDQLVAKYKVPNGGKVVFKKTPTGTAERNSEAVGSKIVVNWVQLWKDGPKFAEYNIGAANNKPEDHGGYYTWGGSQDKVDDHNEGTEALTGEYDTATKLWGSNWRMPTQAELKALLNSQNCTCTWTEDYNGTGVNGLLCTGKENTDYAFNSVFLPAAGDCYDGGVRGQGSYGYYWSSTPDGSSSAYRLDFDSGGQYVGSDYRGLGYSVRAVLNE